VTDTKQPADQSDDLRNSRARSVRALHELPAALAPPRDLWPDIARAIAAQAPQPQQFRFRGGTRLLTSLAASLALIALGVLLGRGVPLQNATVAASAGSSSAAPPFLRTALQTDPRLAALRNELLDQAEQRLTEMSPQERAKVVASLASLRRSMAEIEAAMGREPANALLQELLVDTYQEEMRVLAAVAGDRQEI